MITPMVCFGSKVHLTPVFWSANDKMKASKEIRLVVLKSILCVIVLVAKSLHNLGILL